MDKDEKYKAPVRTAGDAGHAVLRAGLGAIPYAGAAATELLNAIVTPPLEKRRSQWMEEVGNGLRQLESKMGVILEDLPKNDDFIDTVVEATRIAITTSNRQKKEALKNAILNSALPNPPEESLQKMFLSFIDTLTIWHLKLLELFNNPRSYVDKHKVKVAFVDTGSLSQLVENAFTELSGERALYDLIWKDLYSKALVNVEQLHVNMTSNGVFQKRTTKIAELFLDYIKNPIPTDK